MMPPNPNICTPSGPYITCLAHQPVSSQNIYRASLSHTAEPLAVRPINQQPQGLDPEAEEASHPSNRNLGPDQVSSSPSNPPALAARRRSYCKTLHLLLLPGLLSPRQSLSPTYRRRQMQSCASWVTESETACQTSSPPSRWVDSTRTARGKGEKGKRGEWMTPNKAFRLSVRKYHPQQSQLQQQKHHSLCSPRWLHGSSGNGTRLAVFAVCVCARVSTYGEHHP